MTARIIPNVGSHIVTELDGEEWISFRTGSQGDKQIQVKNLRHYFGGDIAKPAIYAENGANARKISHFPNAGIAMAAGDVLTGLQNGQNVNFSRAQILAPLVEAISKLIDERIMETLKELGYNGQTGNENGRPGNS